MRVTRGSIGDCGRCRATPRRASSQSTAAISERRRCRDADQPASPCEADFHRVVSYGRRVDAYEPKEAVMHARMTAVQVAPGQADAAVSGFVNTVPGTAKAMGAKGTVLLVNRETGEGLSFTLWEDEAAMRASEERANELRSSTTEEMGTEVTRIERYEVAFLEMD
jgi:heme-degrading monooxygenase HmoA